MTVWEVNVENVEVTHPVSLYVPVCGYCFKVQRALFYLILFLYAYIHDDYTRFYGSHIAATFSLPAQVPTSTSNKNHSYIFLPYIFIPIY